MNPNDQSNYWQHPEADEQPAAQEAPAAPVAPQPAPVAAPAPTAPAVPVESPQTVPAPPEALTAPVQAEPVHWQAKEYLHHERNALWFIGFGVVTLGLLAVAIFLMQSWTFALLVVVMAAAVLVLVYRPPRTLDYTLTEKGLYVGEKMYGFSEFKSFGVIRDGSEYSVALIPTKRFSPAVTVYFPETSGEQIVDMLGARLPMETLHLDVIDRVVRKLRL